jgi:hypothetical protein
MLTHAVRRRFSRQLSEQGINRMSHANPALWWRLIHKAGLSGGCSSASRAGKCACSAPTAMSSTRWCWRSATLTREKVKPSPWNATTLSSGIGPRLCDSAPSLSPSLSPCLARIHRMRCRPDSGGLPPRKGSNAVLLCSPTCTLTRMLPLRCTSCRSRLVGSSHLPKMQH